MLTITTNITHSMPIHQQKGNNHLNFVANIKDVLSQPRNWYSLSRNMSFEVRCEKDSDSHSRLLQIPPGSPDSDEAAAPSSCIFSVRQTQRFHSAKLPGLVDRNSMLVSNHKAFKTSFHSFILVLTFVF